MPEEWRSGAARAREVRSAVAEQLSSLITGREMTGSEAAFARRLRELALAKRTGDASAVRAAVMDVAVDAAAWAVALDLEGPVRPRG